MEAWTRRPRTHVVPLVQLSCQVDDEDHTPTAEPSSRYVVPDDPHSEDPTALPLCSILIRLLRAPLFPTPALWNHRTSLPGPPVDPFGPTKDRYSSLPGELGEC